MKAWADIIRWDGNEATHEEDEVFEEQDATRMRDFTEVFLLYAFTLPGRVASVQRSKLVPTSLTHRPRHLPPQHSIYAGALTSLSAPALLPPSG